MSRSNVKKDRDERLYQRFGTDRWNRHGPGLLVEDARSKCRERRGPMVDRKHPALSTVGVCTFPDVVGRKRVPATGRRPLLNRIWRL